MNKSPNTPPNRTLHQKTKLFYPIWPITPKKSSSKQTKTTFWQHKHIHILPKWFPYSFWPTTWPTLPWENVWSTTHLQKPFRFHFDALGQRCCWVMMASLRSFFWKGTFLIHHTVDGRNPASVDMVNIPFFTRFYTSQVVQDIFHQQ